MDSQKRIKKLEKEILKNKDLYYAGNARISDEDFDKLEDELRELDPENDVLKKVGAEVSGTNKVAHDKKMLSLNKTYKFDDLLSWKNNYDVISTYKIDGSSCSLVYKKGKLYR